MTGARTARSVPKGDDLPHVKRVRSKERDYYYFDTGTKNDHGKRIYNRLPDIKAPNFGDVYAAMKAGVTRRAEMLPVLTVAGLIRHYERSPEFNRLSGSTQRTYGYALRKIADGLGAAPVDDVQPRDFAGLLALMGDAAGSVNITRRVMSALYTWGKRKHHVAAATDPVGASETIPMGSHEPWPQKILDAALACEKERVRLAVHLLYYTAQRIRHTSPMRWADVQGDTIAVVQRKTSRALTIKLHQNLADILAATPKRGLTILTQADGRPVGDDAIRKEIQAFTSDYGVKMVPTGLLKNPVTAHPEPGCTGAGPGAGSGEFFP